MADIPLVPIYNSNWEYHNPTGDEFPVMASDARPNYPSRKMPGTEEKQYVLKSEFQRLHQCGFNLVRLGNTTWDLRKSSSETTDTGVTICATTIDINQDNNFKDKDLTISDVANYYLGFIDAVLYDDQINVDSISMLDFGDELKMELMRKIAVPYNIVREREITQLPIFNRSPSQSNETDLEELQQLFHPAVWCYDLYPVQQKWEFKKITEVDGKTNYLKIKPVVTELPIVKENMYLLLETYRQLALKTKRPFWYYVLSMEYFKVSDKNVDKDDIKEWLMLVSEDYMRFSVFTALAYGTKGLRYWTYTLRKPYNNEYYIKAPVDLDNKCTEVWRWVWNVNKEVHALGKIFLNSEVQDVCHTGETIPPGTKRLPDGFGPWLKLTSGIQGVTVSMFRSCGKSYVMLVNHDINDPQEVEMAWHPHVVPFIASDECGVNGHFTMKGTRFEDADGMPQARRVDTIVLDPCGYYIARWEYIRFSENMAYQNPTGTEFPIMAGQPCQEWVTPVTSAMFTGLKECGINLVNINHNIWEPVESAEILTESNVPGLYVSVSNLDWEDTSECLRQIREYSGIDSIRVWNLYSDLSADPLVVHMGLFAQTYNSVRSLDTGRLLLWNILGTSVLENSETLNYLNQLALPSMWCDYATTIFTQKCDTSGKPADGSAPVMITSYYARLEEFKRISKASGRPFWHYVSCMSHHTAGKSFMAAVTEETMRFTAFSGLAYGAKGIRWWGYAIRKSTDSVSYLDAPIDAEGNRTALWHSVQRINAEINEFQDIFLHSHDNEVYHCGDTIPQGATALPLSVGPFIIFEASGEGVLVSTFRANGVKYVMVVNHSVSDNQIFTVRYDQGEPNFTLMTDTDRVSSSYAADHSSIMHSDPYQEIHPKPDPDDPTPQPPYESATFRLSPAGYAIFFYE